MPQIVSKEYIVQSRFVFHCTFKIKIPRSYGESLLQACFDLVQRIDTTYNSYQPESYFSQLNTHPGQWVQVDKACVDMLDTLLEVCELSKGSYDITCMPLLKLWGFYQSKELRVPTETELSKVLQQVDYTQIQRENQRVRIAPGQQIITGSFIKAYAVDCVIDFLKEQGVTDAIVNAGGSTMRCLNDSTHESWNIQYTELPSGASRNIALSNQSFSMSARANNFIQIKDKQYGHILNSVTGIPSQTQQVLVVTANAFLSDVLATALFAMADHEFSMFLEKLSQVYDFRFVRTHQDGQQISNLC